MRKLSILLLLALLASPAFSAPSATSTSRELEEPELMTICYYGVTMTVTPKIAKRYIKLGATAGACGEEPDPEECPPGFIRVEIFPGFFVCFPDGISTSLIQKPASSEKAIQLDQPADAPTNALISLGTGKLVAGK